MTMPVERTRHLIQAGAFLRELSANMDVPKQVRAEAYRLLRHFPSVSDVQAIAANEARLQEVAKYVDAQMKDLSQSTATIDSFRLAVLAALNIANERFDLADRLASRDNAVQAQFEALSAKAERISVELDEAMR